MQGDSPPCRHVGVAGERRGEGYSGCVQITCYVPPDLPDDKLEAVADEHARALKAYHGMAPTPPAYDMWLLRVPGNALRADGSSVQYVHRESASRAADVVRASVAAELHEHFMHELASAVIDHVRKPPPGWTRTPVWVADYNLGLAIGAGGQRVRAVGGAWNWDCQRPLSGVYVLSVQRDPRAAEEHYADLPRPDI